MSQKFVLLNSCTIIFDQNFMKLLEDVYFQFLLSTCIQNFSNWHALFVFFLSNSVAAGGMKWETACRPSDDPF